MDHTFVICAYKRSLFLEKCIHSLKKQTICSKIIMVTSTPNEYIEEIAKKYNIPLYIRKGKSDIATDWNYGYSKADTPYVTIAHQDDIYMPIYTEQMLNFLKESKYPLIAFSDYSELRNEQVVTSNKLLKIKRILLTPLKFRICRKSIFVRRKVLSIGNAICCPSVTYAKKNLPDVIFNSGFQSNIDWEAWEKLSKLKGEFIYINKSLMCHRIHEKSTTTKIKK